MRLAPGLLALLLVLSPSEASESAGTLTARWLAIHGRRLDSVVYDFTGDGKPDILNSSIDFDADPPVRWLALHPQDAKGGFDEKPAQIWTVDPRACALAFGNFLPGGGVEIGFVAPDGVYVYPYADGAVVETPAKLIHTRTFFTTPSERTLPVWQWATDLSHDGLDDLIVPVPDGYKVYFQTEPGRYGKVYALEADLKKNRSLAAQRSAGASKVLSSFFTLDTSLPRITPVDIDGDGLLDLVSIEGNLLTVFFQREARTFSSAGNWRWRFPVTTLESQIQRDVVHLSLVDFKDIDGDGNADLVVTQVHGEVGLLDSIKTTLWIHLGNGRGQFTPTHRIMIDGVSIDPDFVDMNGDGALDCITSRLRTDLLNQAAKGFILGDISVDYEVFQFDKATRGYLGSPVYAYPVRVRFEDIQKKGAGSRPMMFVRGDFNGDGKPDQVRLNPKTDELEFHAGRTTGQGTIDFTPTPWQSYTLDRVPRGIHFVDANGDGQMDVMLFYSGQLGLLLSTKPR